jgi:hypothetical protein
LKFAGALFANVRHSSPAFILELTAGLNSSQAFARVRHSSPALLSTLLSNLQADLCLHRAASPTAQEVLAMPLTIMRAGFNEHLVKMERAKRGWQICLAKEAPIS